MLWCSNGNISSKLLSKTEEYWFQDDRLRGYKRERCEKPEQAARESIEYGLPTFYPTVVKHLFSELPKDHSGVINIWGELASYCLNQGSPDHFRVSTKPLNGLNNFQKAQAEQRAKSSVEEIED